MFISIDFDERCCRFWFIEATSFAVDWTARPMPFPGKPQSNTLRKFALPFFFRIQAEWKHIDYTIFIDVCLSLELQMKYEIFCKYCYSTRKYQLNLRFELAKTPCHRIRSAFWLIALPSSANTLNASKCKSIHWASVQNIDSNFFFRLFRRRRRHKQPCGSISLWIYL